MLDVAKCNLGKVKIKPMLVSGGPGFMRPEVTYGVSRIACALLFSRVRLYSLLRAPNCAFVLPFLLSPLSFPHWWIW